MLGALSTAYGKLYVRCDFSHKIILRECPFYPILYLHMSPQTDRLGLLITTKEGKKMDTCIACNENSVDVTELYCFGCYLDRELEAMIGYGYTDQLFLTKEND